MRLVPKLGDGNHKKLVERVSTDSAIVRGSLQGENNFVSPSGGNQADCLNKPSLVKLSSRREIGDLEFPFTVVQTDVTLQLAPKVCKVGFLWSGSCSVGSHCARTRDARKAQNSKSDTVLSRKV